MSAILSIFDLFAQSVLVLVTAFVSFTTDFLQDVNALSQWFFSAALLTAAALLLRWLLKGKLSCRARYALWLVVLLRLLLPVQLTLPLPINSARLAPEPAAVLEQPILVLPEVLPAPQPVPESEIDPDKLTADFPVIEGQSLRVNAVSGKDLFLFVWKAGAVAVLAALVLSNAWFDLSLTRRRRRLELPEVPIPVYEVEDIPSPCLFGVFHPAVYLTPAIAADPVRREHVLAHELTHYRHRDHLWALLRCLCLVIHWFDPLVWAAAILSKRDCELACDEGAVARLGEEARIPYGKTLVDMVAQKSRGGLLSCSTTMTGGAKTVRQRVEALVRRPESKKTALFLAVSLLTAAAIFTFAGDEPKQQELGLPTPEEGYTRLVELLENDLPFYYYEPLFSDGPEYDAVTSPNIIPNTKATALNHIHPLDAPMENLTFSSVRTQAHHLWLYGGEGPDLYETDFCLLPVADDWYICLRESDENENDTLIPVARTNGGVVNVLKNAASLQLQVNSQYWKNPQNGFDQLTKSLPNTVLIHAFVSSGQSQSDYRLEEAFTVQALELLGQAQPLSAPAEDFSADGNDLILHLYDELGTTSPAGWNCRDYYLHPAPDGYYLCLRHDGNVDTPIALLPGDTAARLLALAYGGHMALEEYDRFRLAVESLREIKFCAAPLSSSHPITYIQGGEDLENAKRMLLEYSSPLTYGADVTRAGVPLYAFVLLAFDSSMEYEYNISPTGEGEYAVFRVEDGQDIPVALFDRDAVGGLGLLASATPDLTGSWSGPTQASVLGVGVTQPTTVEGSVTFTFSGENTCLWETDYAGQLPAVEERFTYAVSGDQLTLVRGDGSLVVFTFSLDAGVLTLNGRANFVLERLA